LEKRPGKVNLLVALNGRILVPVGHGLHEQQYAPRFFDIAREILPKD
jgi:hypothetical protein